MKRLLVKLQGRLAYIRLDGEIGAENASEVQEALMVSLSNADHVVVDLENVSKIDIVCTQLFEIAKQKARQLKKILVFSDRKNEATHSLIY